MRGVENAMRKVGGEDWIQYKNRLAYQRQHKQLKKEESK
jgi:hypothetical protein